MEEIYHNLSELILSEFPHIVESVSRPHGKLRIHLTDESYLDIWFSRKIPDRFAYHWEHRHVDEGVHRHDNRPHDHLEHLASFPKHFHDGNEENVKESHLSNDPKKAVRDFLEFIEEEIRKRD